MASIRGEEERRVTDLNSCRALVASPVSVYSFPYGGNKLFDLSLLKLQEESQVKVGTEKFLDHLKKFLFRNVLAGWALHGVYSIKDRGQKTKLSFARHQS